MALTSVNIRQEISAKLTASSYLSSNIPIGGLNTVTDSCDIGFEFVLKSGDAANKVVIKWANSSLYNRPTLHSGETSGTITGDLYSTQRIAGESDGLADVSTTNAEIIQDASLTDIVAIHEIKAVYYEAPSSNSTAITITSSDNALGDLVLNSNGASALIIPRLDATTSMETEFDFAGADAIVKVVVLANST